MICEPEILDYSIDDRPKFLVVASDGVFEYCSNEEVMRAVIPFYESNDL